MAKKCALRLPVHQGTTGWSAILPSQANVQSTNETTSVDVAIVGGGFAGLSAAHRLAELDSTLKVAVLEAGRISEGAAGRNSGFMIDLPHRLTSEDYAGDEAQLDRTLTVLNRHAIEFTSRIMEKYDIPPAYFDQCGKVNGAASEKGHNANQSYANYLKQLGEPYETLDQQSMFELTGSRHFISGLYTPGTALIQPAGYVQGLATGLVRNGTRIAEQSPVVSLEKQGDSWSLETPSGVVKAGKVILATNGHLESFGFKRGRLMHIFLFAAMSAEMDQDAIKRLGGQPHWGVTPSDPMGTTMRRISTPHGGNRMITRACAVYQPNMQTTDGQLARSARVMRQKFDYRYPQLAGFPMEYVWSGHLCLSYNAVSVVQELEPGLFSACVQNGLGTTRGALTGIAAAEMAMQLQSSVTSFFDAEAEPKLLPPDPISRIGANAYLRWREWIAAED